jgi:hypothetical protein
MIFSDDFMMRRRRALSFLLSFFFLQLVEAGRWFGHNLGTERDSLVCTAPVVDGRLEFYI